MGPIALFDKSFLQSLSLDESVWFDHFFIPNVCPLFYVETLADLEKSVREGRSPEKEVGVIADKTPSMHGGPCTNYLSMAIGNLLGHPVPMTGQIPLSGGRLVRDGDERGVVFDEPAESRAFARWQEGKFLEVERQFARAWRQSLSQLDLKAVGHGFRVLGIDGKTCKSLDDARALAHAIVSGRDKPFERMKLAITFLDAPRSTHQPILKRWSTAGYPSLHQYAPYAAYVLDVEIFFQIAIAASLISSQRPSNRVDVAYLFYLPFCMVFASSDGLHRRCAPLFLRQDQDFLWGPDLKSELKRVNEHFASLPESIKEKGIMAFAHYPPGEAEAQLVRLWDRHLPRWREVLRRDEVTEPVKNAEIASRMKKMSKAPALGRNQVDFDPQDPDSLTIQRFLSKRRGSWWQLPKDLKDSDEDG
jgi:hypothetical protein